MGLASYSKFGWVDESIPDLSAYRAVLPEGFEAWLAVELGFYRERMEGGPESKGDNVRALREIVKRLDAVLEIDLQAVPSMGEALLTEAAFRGSGNAGVSALIGFRQLRAEAQRARDACEYALHLLENAPARTGRPGNPPADRLLMAVTQRLNCKRLAERLEMAVQILALCRVQVPDATDPETLMRIYRRARAKNPDLKPPVGQPRTELDGFLREFCHPFFRTKHGRITPVVNYV